MASLINVQGNAVGEWMDREWGFVEKCSGKDRMLFLVICV